MFVEIDEERDGTRQISGSRHSRRFDSDTYLNNPRDSFRSERRIEMPVMVLFGNRQVSNMKTFSVDPSDDAAQGIEIIFFQHIIGQHWTDVWALERIVRGEKLG